MLWELSIYFAWIAIMIVAMGLLFRKHRVNHQNEEIVPVKVIVEDRYKNTRE
jgi:hypothetical protein